MSDPSRPIVIALQIVPPMRAWHGLLVERLRARGFDVAIRPVAGAPGVPRILALAMALERTVYRRKPGLSAPMRRRPVPMALGSPDAVIVLGGPMPAVGRIIELWFDDIAGEAALSAALARDAAPRIEVRSRDDGGTRTLLAAGRPAIEDPSSLSRSLDQLLLRTVALIEKALVEDAPGDVADAAPPVIERRELSPPRPPFGVIARGLLRKIAGRLRPERRRPDHWRIHFRLHDGPGIAAAHALDYPGMTALRDDGSRFHADPFPIEHDGRRHIFFEDFPLATGKGVIGRVEIDDRGIASPARIVLETPVHLSYPFLLRHGGAIYMLPEMSAARRVQLYRADPFPDRWVPDRVLLDGVVASDATPILHDGTWWLFATLSDDGGSSWDQLGLFHAPDLFGPWTAHLANPVLVDAGSARPAGAMWHKDGILMRVAQDCRTGYGAGLAICRVDRLDPAGFSQTVVARIGPPAATDATGVHTLNRDGALETIDLRLARAGRRR